MKKSLVVLGLLAVVAYFGMTRDVEARLLRWRNRAAACPPAPCQSCGAVVEAVPLTPLAVQRDWPPAYGPRGAVKPSRSSAAETKPKDEPKEPAVPETPPIPSVPMPTPPAGKLYLLVLSDDKAQDGGDANKAGAAMIERLVREGVSKDRLASVVALTGADITAETIRDRLAGLPIRADDAIFCYYSGPATYDDASKAFTLTPDGVRLPRADLLSELQLQFRSQIVLLTDAPAHAARADAPAIEFPAAVASLDKLLIGPKRVIDIHAASPGESAFARGGDGGFFTLAVVQELATGPQSWPQFVAAVTTTTERLYKQYRTAVLMSDAVSPEQKRLFREQPTQTPSPQTPLDTSSSAPVPPDEPKVPTLPPPEGVTRRTADVPPRPSELIVRLPAGAKLAIDGEATKQTSAERHFETPPLKAGKTYVYRLRAEFARDGRPVVREERVEIRAGEEKIVTIE